jgi:purine-cytosine permease-like protein
MDAENKHSHERRRRAVTSAEILVIAAILLCIVLLFTGSFSTFFSILYSPFSFIILVVIITEYIILKGTDRSRIYRIEIDRLREKRKEDIAFNREIEAELQKLQSALNEPVGTDSGQRRIPWKKVSEETREKLQKLLQRMKTKT